MRIKSDHSIILEFIKENDFTDVSSNKYMYQLSKNSYVLVILKPDNITVNVYLDSKVKSNDKFDLNSENINNIKKFIIKLIE